MLDRDDVRNNLTGEPETDPEEREEEVFEDEYEDWDWEDEPRKKGKKGLKILIGAAAVLVVVLVAAALWINANFVIAGGLYPRDAQALDLREKKISLKNYDKLTEELPGCDIRWNVPLGDGRYDNRSETLAVPDLSAEEVGLFAHFTDLQSLDITGAELSVAEYETLAGLLPGCHIRWSIPIGGGRYDSAAAEIAVGDFTADEVALFALFDELKTLDATACRCYDEILAVRELLPETEVLWTMQVENTTLNQDARELRIEGSAQGLMNTLRYLPALEKVTVTAPVSSEEQLALAEAYPNIVFAWDVTLNGKTYPSTVEEISYAGSTMTAAQLQELEEKLGLFSALKTLDLSGCGLTAEQVEPLYDRMPGLAIYWEFELYGVTVSATATELDLSNIAIEDIAPLEKALARMPFLERVTMCDCGVSDAVMEELCQKYENVRFVWTVQIGPYRVRTDATGFIGTTDMFVDLTNEDCEPLKYCVDLQALDLGHKSITHLEFVRNMPNLKYLIISRSLVRSFAPLAGLENLVQLEAFLVPASDLEVLLECPNLKDLHIGYIGADRDNPEVVDILSQMTQLERLWYGDNLMTNDNEDKLKAALPNCVFFEAYRRDDVFLGGWRQHERYYEMRDLLGMFYMNEQGIEVGYKVLDGEWIFPGDERY